MGAIHVTVSLRATIKSRKKFEDEFLVDTGAADSRAPGKLLKKAGIELRREDGVRIGGWLHGQIHFWPGRH